MTYVFCSYERGHDNSTDDDTKQGGGVASTLGCFGRSRADEVTDPRGGRNPDAKRDRVHDWS